MSRPNSAPWAAVRLGNVALLVLLHAFPVWDARAASTIYIWGNHTAVPSGLTNVVAIAAGDDHYLALKEDGTVVSWGSQTNVPTGLTNVTAIAAGEWHSLAVKADGTVVAWGSNDYGQSTVPPDLTNVVAVAGSAFHSLALKGDGTVVGWGRNGQINVPPSATNVVAISAGCCYGLLLMADGSLVVLIGDAPPGLTNIVAIASHLFQTLLLKADGTVDGWGRDYSPPPPSLTNAVAIAAGYGHGLAVKSDSTVVAWGYDPYGTGHKNVPLGLTNVARIAAGYWSSMALVQNGPPLLITVPPQGRVVVVGESVGFSTTVISSEPYTFQWRFNGQDLAGATNATLGLTNVNLGQAGLYTVRVSNVLGAVTSSEALLTVLPLRFAAQPQSQIVVAGQSATFGVTVQGASPFVGLLRKNGQRS